MTTPLARTAFTVLAGGLLACATAGTAHAVDSMPPAQLAPAERAAASSAATTSRGLELAASVAKAQAKKDGGVAAERRVATARPQAVAGTATQVDILSPEFVAKGRGPVGRLAYVATTARVGDETVSVWAAKAKDGSGWKPVNAAAGDLEARMARAAGRAQVLNEPQINAWYAVKGDRVVPLNAEARASVGAGMSLAEYQKVVHGKYADKMPGSAYDRAGMAGGFGGPAQQAPAAAVQAAPAQAAPAETAPAVSSGATAAAGLGVAAVIGTVGAVVTRRRRDA